VRAVVAVALGLLLAAPALAALTAREDVAFAPAAKTPPVTLAAGATGTTTLGASGTTASTTRSGLPIAYQEVLLMQEGSASYDVQVRLDTATGFGALDSATLRLVRGAVTQVQNAVTLGVVTQTIGTPVTLPPSGADISVQVIGTKVSGGSSVLGMTILLSPTGSSLPAISYRYTLTIT
jgi:hypothetical protein